MMLTTFVNEVLRPFWGVWAMLFFVGIVFYAYRPANRRKFEDYGRIPFKDDTEER
jgi:cytochrome c oxidase cbb3-type subunit 4